MKVLEAAMKATQMPQLGGWGRSPVVKIGIKVVKSMDFAILLTLMDLDP
ncbi:hypothetical protein L195_g044028, partial [Trifolium pratense]